ncbi:ribonuclease H-like domain-containing protein [Tanacetum coccineum]|uniref:Ribonuclease H-like domain-containing protein n=1 Tax=Tanacetum coccineum TaxID=301880 RepID=A0ABQ5IQL7_9ASTR
MLKQAISKNLKLYDALYLHSSKVHVNVCDTEEILKDATKSQIKMENKLKDPIAIEKKQIFRPIGYRKLNDLYETFVLQVELSAEQKYFSSVSMSSEIPSSESTWSSPPERVKSILLLAILDEYLLKFHYVPDAKSLWAAIKSRFGGNEESKKKQKNVLKHQFENFTTTSNESLDKAYDRFQKLISQLEVHGAPVSKEDINQKFLRSLPPSWSQIALIMRNKPDIDQVDIDDLYNNLRVYEDEMKRSSSSTSNSQNLAFLSSENTSSTNEVSTASGNFGVNTAGGNSSSNQVSSTPGADEVVCSFFAHQATSPPLDNEDLQQIDQDDLEELDIRQQVAMLTVRVQRFVKKTGRNLDFKGKQPECKSGRNQGKRSNDDNGRRNATTNEPSSQALVAQDGLGGYDWSNDFDEPINYDLMAISSSSSSSSSNNEVQNYSKQCLKSFKTLQKNYDSEREKHKRARLEIQGYELALELLESRILGHEKNELAWGKKYEFQNYELKCRELKINNLNMELEKVVKERDELNIKIAKWEESSKSLNILLNSQMSAHDKNGLGYGTQKDEMSNKSKTDSEISMSIFKVRSSDEETTPANDRFSKADGYHVVPPPIIGNFLTPRADISFAGLDEYAIRKKIIESKTTELNADTSKSKTSETVGNTNEVNVEKPKSVNESVVSTPNINKDKVIIEDWKSDDKDDVSEVSPVKTNEAQTSKTQFDKIGQTSKKAGIGFKKIKACFVCKSTDHLIKDCDFYDKKSPEPKLKNVVNIGQRVVKPVWDNAKRVNHQKISNKLKYPQAKRTFVPSGVLTRTGLVNPVRTNGKRAVHTVSTARPISTARPVSTARPFALKLAQNGSAIRSIYLRMDNVRPRASYSPIKRSYYTKPAFRPKNLKQDVKTSGVKNMTTAGTRAVVNTGKGKMNNDLKKSRWVWRPKGNYMDHESKEKGSFILKKFEYVDPKGISKSVIMKITMEALWLLEVIPEEVYVQQPPSFVDPAHPNKVYKVIKDLYDLHQAPRACQDKYVADILKKFDFCSIKTATTPIEFNKLMVKDKDRVDVDVHIYRSMIGSLMYLTVSRPDIMFAVCVCARFQVTPKASHLNTVKRIFRYLNHQPKLGLWYPRDSPFELEAFSDSDYEGASLDRKSTIGGCQFLGRRLISWQCKKQTIVANSTTKAEYVAAANCCGQVLWIQNQMMDYGLIS